ncbi:MAG: TlpA family protein disulfide reductase [Verrucomicrobiales bacterium]|nr:TlpA disulfide reductase family protein [Verrucomicrobiota bacterium JB025]
MKTCHSVLLAASLITATVATPLTAEPTQTPATTPETVTTSVTGRVAMPGKVPDGVNAEGLSLADTVIMLEGAYKHPRMPYPANWSEMKPEDRRSWREAFMDSDAYDEYTRTVEEARSKRASYTAEIGDDGSFEFKNIKPAWYQLSVLIMHPGAKGRPSFDSARARAMRQFIIKDATQPFSVGTMQLELRNVLLPGDPAPEWTAERYDGGTLKLSDFRGKFVLFDLWATWCGPCIAEIPNLKAIHEEFSGERFQVVGLNVDNSIDLAKAFDKKKPSPYTHGFLGAGAESKRVHLAYGIDSIPSIWLIGPDGRIIARDLRGKAMHEAVKAALEAE